MNNLLRDFKAYPKRYTTLLGSVFVMTAIGAIGSLANISPYLISYLRERADQTSLRYSQTLYIHTVQILALSMASLLAGLLRSRLGLSLKQLTIIGLVLIKSVILSLVRCAK